MSHRVLVAFVDALGPRQVDELGVRFEGLSHRRELSGHLGYSSGALASVLTGAPPSVHGRMCLFSSTQSDGPGPLAPLRWLGLLPRVLHERAIVRRWVGRWFARARRFEGYFALHRIPPAAFEHLDVEEREDLFQCEKVGGATTFLSRARAAGLGVYASPWQLPEAERWKHAAAAVRSQAPDLVFAYAAALDGALHTQGNGSAAARRALATTADEICRLRDSLGRDGSTVTTIVVGDHGMADVHQVVDPTPVLRSMNGGRVFVDSTMLRLWGSDRDLRRARERAASAWPFATYLDLQDLAAQDLPARGAPYGDAIVVLPEGRIFAPSYVGGFARGMHGYQQSAPSAHSALLSDAPLADDVRSLTDVARVVESALDLPS